MPKEIFKIDQFHGGLNTAADPRDIADNELAEATDAMVDSIGRITTIGSFGTHDEVGSTSNLDTPIGKGLMQFSNDREGANDAGTGEVDNTGGDDYLAIADYDSSANLAVYSKNASNIGTPVDMGSDGNVQPVLYYSDGALRICDGLFSNTNNTPKWYGYIEKTYFSGLNGASGSGSPEHPVDGWITSAQEITAIASNKVNFYADGFYYEKSLPAADGNSSNDGAISLSIKSVFADSGGWRGYHSFYCSLIYDGVQESALTLITGTTNSRTSTGGSDSEFSGSYLNLSGNHTNTFKVFVDPGAFTGNGFNERCTGARIYWKAVDTAKVAYGDAYLLLELDWVRGVKSSMTGDITAWAADTVTTSSSDPPTGGSASNNSVMSAEIHYTDEPRLETYRSLTGFSEDCIDLGAKYKTAVVANRMTYIGNIFAKSKNSPNADIVQGDAMIKSPVNQFDVFPTDRLIEVTIRDGDEIIHLEEFADRILQFKKKKLFIINISQEIEFLEDQLNHRGVNTPAAVCKTEFGVIWANAYGVFMYNGERVSNLLEKQGRRLISESDWSSFLTADADPMVGYVPHKRHIIVAGAVDAGADESIYLFDLVTTSWVKSSASKVIAGDKTNFANDWNGKLIYHANNVTYQWNDASVASSSFSVKTKDFDLGHPGVKKNIYRVYISYKGDGSGITVKYAKNGDNDTYTTLGTLSNVGTDDWVSGSLTPSSPIIDTNSIQLQVTGTAAADFEINDMSIVYRRKSVR